MGRDNRIRVNKQIYEWAIMESQKDFEEIKARFNRIEDWVDQISRPTFRQLERLANYLKVPLGYMFLDEPPKSDIIETEFKTIADKLPDISKNLKDTIYNMGRRQDWIGRHRQGRGWEKIIPDNINTADRNNVPKFAELTKDFLDIDEFWYENFKAGRLAYNFLRGKMELKGIIVMQNGVVGLNTHRKLDINEFRGFVLYDELAPLIFINRNDSQAGRIFTLIYEYIRVLSGEDDVLIGDGSGMDDKSEKQVHNIAVEFLMPESHLIGRWDEEDKGLGQIRELSKLFHVDRLYLALRLEKLGLIDNTLISKVEESIKKDLERKAKARKSTGGDYWATYRSRFSDNFIRSVVQSVESGEMSYSHALNLLNISAKNYNTLRESIIGYEQ